MTIDISGLRTQPRPRPALDHETDDSGADELALLDRSTKDALADFWPAQITPADLRPPSDRPFVPLKDRQTRRSTDPTRNWRSRLEEVVRPHHALLDSKAVAGARAELATRIEEAQAAADSVNSTDADRKAEQAAHVAEARADAATGGTGIEAPAFRDWDTVKAARLAIFNGAHAAASKAANVYRSTVASEAPRRIDAVLTTAEKRRAKAHAAVKSITADVQAAVEAAEAVKAFESEFGLSGTHGWHRFTDEERAMHSRALHALDGVRTYLARTDDPATGRWILDESPSLPLHSRAELAQASGGTRDRWILAQAELDDEFQGRPALTDTHDSDDERDSLFAKEHLAKRSLPR